MVYVSVDIETSGLNPDMNSVLSIGAIIEDTTTKLPYEELPKFNIIVLNYNIQGSPKAITMNGPIIDLMGRFLDGNEDERELIIQESGYKFYEENEVSKEFYKFLDENGLGRGPKKENCDISKIWDEPITINVAGKNFATFDKLFLDEIPLWKKLIRTRHRVLDPSILFVDWIDDKTLPNLITCKERSKIDGIVTHNALEDAWDVIQILRTKY